VVKREKTKCATFKDNLQLDSSYTHKQAVAETIHHILYVLCRKMEKTENA